MVTNDGSENTNVKAKGMPAGTVHYMDPFAHSKNIPKAKTYKPKKGFEIHFDFVSQIERKHREVRVVYGIYQATKPVVPN